MIQKFKDLLDRLHGRSIEFEPKPEAADERGLLERLQDDKERRASEIFAMPERLVMHKKIEREMQEMPELKEALGKYKELLEQGQYREALTMLIVGELKEVTEAILRDDLDSEIIEFGRIIHPLEGVSTKELEEKVLEGLCKSLMKSAHCEANAKDTYGYESDSDPELVALFYHIREHSLLGSLRSLSPEWRQLVDYEFGLKKILSSKNAQLKMTKYLRAYERPGTREITRDDKFSAEEIIEDFKLPREEWLP
jgi:hypothetical protein